MTMTAGSGNPVTVHWDVTEWHKPLGRGRRFARLQRGLARRLRLSVVKATKWDQAHPGHDAGRSGASSYGPPWISDHCLANFSFACECHRNVRFKRNGRPQKQREGRPQ